MTQDNLTVGTPAFMPPELALGKDVDGRTDIYGLGAVAYWLLTGQYVFDSEKPLEVIMKHVHETPAPPSTRTELEIPDALEALVLKCLAKEPSERPASATEVRDTLKTIEGDWAESDCNSWWSAHLPQG